MKAMCFLGNETFALQDRAVPAPGPGEILIKNYACGVCGTDIHIFHGEPGSAAVTPPVVLGHEYAGIVEALGAGVQGLCVGDHVTVDPNIYCGVCDACRKGKKQLCAHMEAVGVTRDGGFEEYSIVPAAQALLLDKEVPLEYGAMSEPLACCVHGIDRAEIRCGDTVCIVGGGAIGLLLLQLAKLSGAAKLVLSEPNAKRREVAKELGADLCFDPRAENAYREYLDFVGGDGADVVIECAGNNAAVESAFCFAGKGATILLFSVPHVDAKNPLPLFDVYQRELTVRGTFVNPDTHSRAVALINSGKIKIAPILTHAFPLSMLPEALAMQTNEESIKVIVKTGITAPERL